MTILSPLASLACGRRFASFPFPFLNPAAFMAMELASRQRLAK